MAHIIVFGDSLAYGCWDKKGGWVQRLRKYLDSLVVDSNYKLDFTVYNLGLLGDTTDTLLKRFNSEVKPRLSEEENLIIFAVGINDSEFFHKDNSLKVPKERFKRNIENLIGEARTYTDKIFFIGPTPVDESKVDPIPWAPDYSYVNKYIKRYNDLVKATCEKQGIPFLELFSVLRKDFKKYLVDGVHLNSKGHKILLSKITDSLKRAFLGLFPDKIH